MELHCKSVTHYSWLIWFVIFQLAAPMDVFPLSVSGAVSGGAAGAGSAMGSNSFRCEICRYIPGLTPSQIDLCCDLPQAILILHQTQKPMKKECQWQFRKELWNCSELDMPLFKEPALPETPEKAFVYALSSATVVHRITGACSLGDLGSECGCDTSRNGLISPQGWQWGSCSDNVSYGVNFAQNFLDERDINTDSSNDTAVRNALVHLFNNFAGREVVKDHMTLSCRCHGISGSCTSKTCWRELPTYYQIGDAVKEKYDNAIKVRVSASRQRQLVYVDKHNQERTPSKNSLVYMEKTHDFCQERANFTRGRQCIPQAMLNSQVRGALEVSSMMEHFPPCETFCCSRSYEVVTTTASELCNCRFKWCCDVICEKCNITMTKYHCTG